MVSKYRIEISEELNGKRIDVALTKSLDGVSRSFVQNLFDLGSVWVNGNQCNAKNFKVSAGDICDVSIPDPVDLKVEAENIPIDIVYEDDDVLVVNKPVGMVVHPAVGNLTGTLVNAVMYHCGDRLSSINGVIRPGIVHRIDKDTSGLLMIAKTDRAHVELSKQLADHTLTRKYTALVQDNIRQDAGTIDLPIGRDVKNRLKRQVNGSGSKPAVTHYRVVERFGFYIFSYLLSKTMGCFSGCLMSSAGIHKLFCGIYSAFKCSFDDFVGEIFLTQGLNPGLPHCRQTLYHLSHQGSQMKTLRC